MKSIFVKILRIAFFVMRFLFKFFGGKKFKMSYKKKTFEETRTSVRKGTTFSSLVDDYIYNEVTGVLEVSPVKKDLQAYIDSFKDTALARVLDKFLPNCESTDEVADFKQKRVDLAVMAECFEIAEEYRDKFNLAADVSYKEIYNILGDKASEMEKALKSKIENKEVKSDVETQKDEPQGE